MSKRFGRNEWRYLITMIVSFSAVMVVACNLLPYDALQCK